MTEKGKDHLHEYLLSTRDFWGQYRTQKENAAWLATTLYLGGLLALDSFLVQNSWSLSKTFLVTIGLLVIITCVLVWFFINDLNNDRFFASHKIAECNNKLNEIFKNELSVELLRSSKDTPWNIRFSPIVMGVWTIATILLLIFLY